MQIKNPLSIIVALVLLVSIFLFGIDFRGGTQNAEKRGGDDISGVSEVVVTRLYKKINEASGSVQFEALASTVMDEAPREQVNSLMELLLDRWIAQDLAAALNFVSDLDEADGSLLRYALVEAGYFNFRMVMEWINRQPESGRQNLIVTLYEGLGAENPEYALRFIDLLNEGEAKENIMRTLLEQWGRRDTAAALFWMNAQTLPPALEELKATLISSLMDRDPQEAGGFIRTMQPGHEKNSLARKYADMIARTDIQTAASWARSLDDQYSYAIALTAVYEAWFQKEPDKKLIMEQVMVESDSELRDRLINEIALDIANNNPAELASMVDRLPESSRPDVAEKAVRFWKERDPRLTLDWVNTLAPGPARDRAAKVMVEDLLLRGDKERGLSLAATIENRSMRYESVRSAAERWYQDDPAEAQQMLNGISFLSESEKATINQHIQKAYR